MTTPAQDPVTLPCVKTLHDALAVNEEWSQLKEPCLAEQRRKIDDLLQKIHEASKPSSSWASHGSSGAFSDEAGRLTQAFNAYNEAIDQSNKDVAAWEHRRRELRSHLLRGVKSHLEAVQAHFDSQILRIDFTVIDRDSDRAPTIEAADALGIRSAVAADDATVRAAATALEAMPVAVTPDASSRTRMTTTQDPVTLPRTTAQSNTPPQTASQLSALQPTSPQLATATQPVTTSQPASRSVDTTTRKRPATAEASEADQRKRQRRIARRTIDFEDVYQNGKGKHRYMIVNQSYKHPAEPALTGDFWIFRCLMHKTHYSSKNGADGTKSSAAKHAGHESHRLNLGDSDKNTKSFRLFGVMVKNCTTELAKKNNDAVQAAIDSGEYHPETQMQYPSGEPDDMLSSPEPIEISDDESAPAQVTESPSVPWPAITPITDPKPGELYIAMWSQGKVGNKKQGYAAVMLPFGSFKKVGLSGSFGTSELAKSVPPCYKDRRVHLGWKPEYQNGGIRVNKRIFPFVCFNNEKGIEDCGLCWIPAGDLRPFELSDTVEQFRSTVEEYQKRHQAVTDAPDEEAATHDGVETSTQRPTIEEEVVEAPSDAGVTGATAENDNAAPSTRTSMTLDQTQPRHTQDPDDSEIARIASELVAEADFSQSTRTQGTDSATNRSDFGYSTADEAPSGHRQATPRAPFPRMHSSTPMPQSLGGDFAERTARLESIRRRQEPQQDRQEDRQESGDIDGRPQSPLRSSRTASNQLRTPEQTPKKASSQKSNSVTPSPRGEVVQGSRSATTTPRTRPVWQTNALLRKRAQDRQP